jgi:hypothetical protein
MTYLYFIVSLTINFFNDFYNLLQLFCIQHSDLGTKFQCINLLGGV